MTTRDSYRGELEQVIAQQIRRYRLGANMTLGTLADLAGISKAMLSKIENAQTSFSLTTLSGLAQALEVPVTALLRGADGEREAILVRAGEGAIVRRSGGGDGHEYRHLGELNDLMAKGLGVVAGKGLAAAIAVGRVEVQDLVDLLDRDEIASMPRVLGLSAALLLGGLGGWRGDAGPVGARGLAAVAGVEPELLPQQRVLRTQRGVLTLQLDHTCFERGDARRHRRMSPGAGA